MRMLADAGITFAVDDFGTGCSSLQHLHRLPISVLKVDRWFVQHMYGPRGSEAIVNAMVSMAHSLGMHVVAEGVETEAQREAALGFGCDTIQGFLYSRPVPAGRGPEADGLDVKAGIRDQGSGIRRRGLLAGPCLPGRQKQDRRRAEPPGNGSGEANQVRSDLRFGGGRGALEHHAALREYPIRLAEAHPGQGHPGVGNRKPGWVDHGQRHMVALHNRV